MSFSAGEPSLEQLKAEIDTRLHKKLAQISEEEATAAAALREADRQKLESQLAGLTKEHELNRKRAAAKLDISIQQRGQAAVWQAEKQLLDQLEQAIRARLVSMPASQQRFNLWLAEALPRLAGDSELELMMNPAWASALSSEDIPVATAEMSGGAQLVDKDSGRTLDGSWDSRLRDQWPEIVQYWQDHVLTNH